MNEEDNALATHMMLDPKVQERLFAVLAEALSTGMVQEPGEQGSIKYTRGPVENFIRALFLNSYFREQLNRVVVEALTQYNRPAAIGTGKFPWGGGTSVY